jgi:hypothetical protein
MAAMLFLLYDKHQRTCPSCQRPPRCPEGRRLWDAWLELEREAWFGPWLAEAKVGPMA